MNGRTIIPIKIDPNPADQVKDPKIFMPSYSGQINIRQVFNGRPHARQLRLCMQWPQSEQLIFNRMGVIMKSWTQNS